MVDLEQRLVGIVTVDDVIDVIEQATRDLYAAGAVQAGDDDDYFSSNLFTVARRRVVWLAVLVLASFFTSEVIAAMKTCCSGWCCWRRSFPCSVAPAATWGPKAPRW